VDEGAIMSAEHEFDVVGLGCSAVDTLGIYEGEIEVDQKMQVYQTTRQGGGLVATGLVAVARLGGKGRFIGRLGDDDPAQLIVRDFEQEGVDTRCIRIVPGMSAIRTIGVIDPSHGHRTLFYCLDDAPVMDPADLNRDEVLAGKVVFVDGFQLKAAIRAAEWAREAGRIVLMDAELTEPENDTLAELATHVVASLRFAQSRVGDCEFKEAARRLYEKLGQKDPDKVVGVTSGADGSCFVAGDGEFCQPSFKVPVVDTTGCGDVFHGAFAFGLARGWDLRRIAKFSSAVAALKTRKLGGRAGIPSYGETEEFLARAGGET
jgi:sugar/nucleoside kinase (ribokinase family)